jgi:DNA polymerase-1
VAKEGYLLLSADYSQVELRILAHLSKDSELIEAFGNNEDVHERTARAIFNINKDEPVLKEQRSAAKAINFGVIYGKTGFSLAKELGIPRSEGQQFINSYFDLYRGVAAFMNETVKKAKEQKAAYTLLGRKRALPEISSSNFNIRQHAERMAKNMPIQGTAADLLKLAMINVDKALLKSGLNAKMLLTVHDELVLEVLESDISDVQKLVKKQMEEAMSLTVPLIVDIGTGKNWTEAH